MGLNDELFPVEITEQCDCIYIAKVQHGFNLKFQLEFMKDKKSIFTRIIGDNQYNFTYNNQNHIEQLKTFINNDRLWKEVPIDDAISFSGNVKKFEKIKS